MRAKTREYNKFTKCPSMAHAQSGHGSLRILSAIYLLKGV